MFLLKQVLPAAIVALAAVAVVSLIAAYCGKERAARLLALFALAVGYSCGHLLITGWTSFPPADTTNWLPYFAVAAAAAGSIAPILAPKITRNVLFGLLCVGALRLLLEPRFRHGWSAIQGWICVAGLATVAVLLANTLRTIDRRTSVAVELPGFLLIVNVGGCLTLMLSGSMLLGQFAAVLAGGVFGTLLLTLRKPRLGCEISEVFSLLFVALLLCGHFFAELPITSAVLLAAAPALGLIPIRKNSPRWVSAFRAALVSIPATAALIFAFRASPPLDY